MTAYQPGARVEVDPGPRTAWWGIEAGAVGVVEADDPVYGLRVDFDGLVVELGVDDTVRPLDP